MHNLLQETETSNYFLSTLTERCGDMIQPVEDPPQRLKIEAILINCKFRDPHSLQFNDHHINWSKSTKYMGILFDKCLTIDAHVEAVIIKATRIRSALYPVINKFSFILAYYSYYY